MSELTFLARLWMAWVCFFQILFRPAFARSVLPAYQAMKAGALAGLPAAKAEAAAPRPAPPAAAVPPEKTHGAALFLLSMLQREGRFVDFLQEEVAPFSDAEVGAAARIVHEGCRKVLRQYVSAAPVMKEAEGARVTVPAGFDANRIRLTGNVTGQGPYAGTLKHPGWVATEVKFPEVPSNVDLRVVAPAEVELG